MPPKAKITREEIIKAAVNIVRVCGDGGLNARGLANALGCSTQPIFSNFESMEQVRMEVIVYAESVFAKFVEETIKSGKYPAYKASGMGYITMAKEEPELFKLLYMRDRSSEPAALNYTIAPIVESIQQSTGLSYEKAELFHVEMWVVVHGIASMIATNYLDWDMDMASSVVTDIYHGLLRRFGVV